MVRPSRPEARSELSGQLLRQLARYWIHVLIVSSEAFGNDPTPPGPTLNLNFSFRLGLEARRIQGSGSVERNTVQAGRFRGTATAPIYEPGASDTDEEDSVSLRMLPADRITYATPAMIIPKSQLKSAPCVAFEIGPVYDGT